jgi:hypothetical protein
MPRSDDLVRCTVFKCSTRKGWILHFANRTLSQSPGWLWPLKQLNGLSDGVSELLLH